MLDRDHWVHLRYLLDAVEYCRANRVRWNFGHHKHFNQHYARCQSVSIEFKSGKVKSADGIIAANYRIGANTRKKKQPNAQWVISDNTPLRPLQRTGRHALPTAPSPLPPMTIQPPIPRSRQFPHKCWRLTKPTGGCFS